MGYLLIHENGTMTPVTSNELGLRAISRYCIIRRVIIPSALVFIVAINTTLTRLDYFTGYTNATKYNDAYDNQNQTSDDNIDGSILEVAQCTPDELFTIQQQLSPDDCLKHQHEPWKQRCSLTYATRCPDATWLKDHYTELHNTTRRQHGLSTRNYNHTSPDASSFLGIFVGCNKGFDAIDAMRMGSGNPIFDKHAWEDAMTDVYKRGVPAGKIKLEHDVCNQATSSQFSLPAVSTSKPITTTSSSQVHCIEPMPATVRALQRSAYKTKYDKMGFTVTHAALSKEDGTVPFPRGDTKKIGRENGGIGSTKCISQNCVNVTMYSLDTYVSKFVPEGAPIDYLSVDVEGYDYNVLLGGNSSALTRVRYLEFEYNWMGAWKDQSLHQAIEYLDQQFGFTCYWAGFDNTIWRITKCWLDFYDLHFWSNVACVSRNYNEVRGVAERMEAMFHDTLAKGEENLRDFEHRFQRRDQ